jgi:hypothetical protein
LLACARELRDPDVRHRGGFNHRYSRHARYKAIASCSSCCALIAAQAGQRGSLWWAAQHRDPSQVRGNRAILIRR